jgi:hypothetical protein
MDGRMWTLAMPWLALILALLVGWRVTRERASMAAKTLTWLGLLLGVVLLNFMFIELASMLLSAIHAGGEGSGLVVGGLVSVAFWGTVFAVVGAPLSRERPGS